MHLRSSAVDLVEEEYRQVFAAFEQWPGQHAWAAVVAELRVVNEIRGHQVDGALDALICPADGTGDGLEQRRLPDADIALQQDMASGEDGDRDHAHRILHSHEHRV